MRFAQKLQGLSPRRKLWLLLALIGSTLPNYFFMAQYLNHGFDVAVAWKLAVANWISSGVTTDLLFASFLFWVFAGFELQRQGKLKSLWIYVVLALGLGLSCALPWFFVWHGHED